MQQKLITSLFKSSSGKSKNHNSKIKGNKIDKNEFKKQPLNVKIDLKDQKESIGSLPDLSLKKDQLKTKISNKPLNINKKKETNLNHDSISLVEFSNTVPLKEDDLKYINYYNSLIANDVPDLYPQETTVPERILLKFDFMNQYGPTSGITRLERWNRSEKLGLNPPLIIKDILSTKQGLSEEKYKQPYSFGL